MGGRTGTGAPGADRTVTGPAGTTDPTVTGPAGTAAPAAGDRLAPVLRPVRAGNGFEEALEQILQLLRLGLVPGGERLPAERELAERMGISRVTLREVLKVLADQGLVESRRGRYGGTFVLPRPVRPDGAELRRRLADVDVEDTLRFREVLETGAAGLAAGRRLTGADADRLRAALAATHDAPLDGYRRQDTLFHLTLAELSGSPSLAAGYAAVRATLNDLLDCIPLLVRNLEHSQRQHTALAEAILDGDADGAREVMREHCEGTAALLRGFLS
ncbi:FadR family transcriptional regulator [Streptomyces clavuligerus]|nr:GntR-family transcriptional regulator [Streptomyces clavuligerus]MBY6305749.1 FadR family transcriptional regulator [Streptomyces clavuligerus]QPL66767.1 FadR family transcriptional regulator [Streptomyces clavuligerus]QPL72848.1 FadR family transcriptional regulator [Streptomyces clavuligerus]QPL78874.1 FadR family transcriptional regulator [Streptomyces clavuligerus]